MHKYISLFQLLNQYATIPLTFLVTAIAVKLVVAIIMTASKVVMAIIIVLPNASKAVSSSQGWRYVEGRVCSCTP